MFSDLTYNLCSLPGVQVVTGDRARALIPDELLNRFEAINWPEGVLGARGATSCIEPFKANGRQNTAVIRWESDGRRCLVLVSAKRLSTIDKARAVALAWAAGVLHGGKGVTP